MRNETRQAFTAYLAHIAQLNGVDAAATATKFAVSTPVQQTLETKIQHSSEFLKRINIVPVTEQNGEKLGLGIGGPIAGRTDTTSADRPTSDPTMLDGTGYACKQTNYDTHLTYAKLDLWAKFPDFQTRIRDVIVRRQALDRIMIGWNGTSAAATTNKVSNPLLQDVNIGWIKNYETDKAANVLLQGTTANQVRIGATGDYKTVDALVYDLIHSMIDPWFREDPNLVVLCGHDLMADKYFPLVNATQAPSEQQAAELVISQKRMGGRQAITVPFFPANALMVTTFDNLSIYFQEGARRRSLIENPKRDRVENYESSNDAYVVEDYGRGAIARNITFV